MSAGRDTWRVQTLGLFSATSGGTGCVLRPSSRRLVALLAVLGTTPRADAAGVLWPDVPDSRAHGNFRTALWRTRVDAPGLLSESHDTVGLDPATVVDFQDVRSWAWRAVRGEEPWDRAPDGATRPLLPTWDDEWLVAPREELRLLQTYALESAAQRLMMAGKLAEAAALAAAALRVDPLRESSNRLLVEIHLREGNRWDALRLFRRYEALLRDELDATPGPGLTALVAPIQGRRTTAAALPERA